MKDESTIKARIQILTSLATLNVSITAKVMEEMGMPLGSLPEQNTEVHYLQLLEAVTSLAHREDWKMALLTVRVTAAYSSGENPDEQAAYHRLVKMTDDLVV